MSLISTELLTGTKRNEGTGEVLRKRLELPTEHSSRMPAIVRPVSAEKRGVSLNLASGRAVIVQMDDFRKPHHRQ